VRVVALPDLLHRVQHLAEVVKHRLLGEPRAGPEQASQVAAGEVRDDEERRAWSRPYSLAPSNSLGQQGDCKSRFHP
jgi:hypothetical protein